ncbi:N,N'-diacetylbacillosaminyl-diphospho-undecaprenol alpha-1,3-N-acetylgalactosaminyltransferase [Kordia antarctica]|uniref:N, N'-diacetylbacillosaminyl-diphospho-undecaprenol alpha-1,3-N-acetylgalactosaminyltransferase n=1 Tax=Kordia antarctica TaxID=1218801 RepID=A0A7L4ZES0_9FLAO|nr:glycosyltransferase [Kordia antarctica]QHI35222.1 N,N'-diacetylbacillosaminyl-diphospho-undecaprenol alpha-1,3-N-acetylgalactosaminyltransferase [Kordia antarctica]
MKTLQVIDTLDAGGAEKLAVTYANALVTEVEASFLCATRKEGLLKDQIANEVGYLFLNRKSTFDFSAVKRLATFIKENEITIVHAHATSFFIVFLVRLYYPKFKMVWHDHYGNSEFLAERKSLVLKIASRWMNGIISVNQQLKDWAVQTLHAKKVIYLSNFPVKNESVKASTKLYGIDGKRIVCLANLRPQKDHFMLLEAFKNLLPSDWTLHLVGKDFEDEYSKKIKLYIKDHGLNKNVFVYGSREDVSSILSQCDIGVLSSQSEGLPIALLEYGLHELAVLATDVGECKRVVSDETKGFLVASKNTEMFTEKLKYLIANEQGRIAKAKQLHVHIQESFAEKVIIQQLTTFYSEL